MHNKKALIAYNGNISSAPRATRLLEYFVAKGYEVSVLSFSINITPIQIKKVYPIIDYSRVTKLVRIKGILISRLMPILIFLRITNLIGDWLWEQFYGLSPYKPLLRNEAFDILVAEDITLLPFCISIKKANGRVFLDAREYYEKEFENSFFFKYFVSPEKHRLCNVYLKKTHRFYTVSEGLADAFAENYSIQRPLVIRSTPFFVNRLPELKRAGLINMVHHGAANRDRQLERMVDVMRQLNNKYTLDFYINGDQEYIQFLKNYAEGCSNIRFMKPVAFNEINNMLVNYDMGFYLLMPTNFNNEHSLPNKFFEFIQARLGIALGPSPEMSKIGRKYGLAVISENFSAEAMVKILKKLNWEDVNKMKQAAHLAAKELCWEVESHKLDSIFL